MWMGRMLAGSMAAPSHTLWAAPHCTLCTIVRFNAWPYLERFALDVETEVLVEMGGKPDLIIGNYRCGPNIGVDWM